MKTANNQIIFSLNDEDDNFMSFEPNGDIFVKGKLIENDIEVVRAMRVFLAKTGLYGNLSQIRRDKIDDILS